MRKLAVVIGALLLVGAVGCGSSDDTQGASDRPDRQSTSLSLPGPGSTVFSADPAGTPTSLSFETVPPAEEPTDDGVLDSGKILMIKLPVGDAEEAKAFYGTVFGATAAAEMGPVSIVTFPDGGPGLVLLPSEGGSSDHGAFIIQVPDLAAAKALALENGATEQGTFTGEPAGQTATSVNLLDPWGNQIEILQLG